MDDQHLAAERIERAAFEDFHAAAPAEARARLGLEHAIVDGAFVSLARHDSSILLNRVVGLGVEAPATRAGVAAIRARYAGAGIGRCFVHVHADARPAELRAWLEAEGFAPYRRWMKFVRGTEPAPEARTDLRVAAVGPEHGPAFGRIVAAGFDLSEASVPVLAALVGRPGWHVAMTFDGETPAGVGALFVQGGVGWYDLAATDPAFRRRGSQSAVLAARLRLALDLGCETIFTETGEAVPGDPQHSYNNILRAGFRELGLRDNYVPAA